jgi:hypothetical protein
MKKIKILTTMLFALLITIPAIVSANALDGKLFYETAWEANCGGNETLKSTDFGWVCVEEEKPLVSTPAKKHHHAQKVETTVKNHKHECKCECE